eukprot:NODE_2348_length_940_cov_71.727273_g1929_i0.p1 GENE.NODE_2348_length_940_cov_71.727273_g1929_i0~~NODE_2348_length_940_cov_71.727273_g1929_i0.p1  ORF type:complete len:205 (+),score=59.30 NODE_2348_length_940_cov_71.727273_g1929_i0:144-758(+)
MVSANWPTSGLPVCSTVLPPNIAARKLKSLKGTPYWMAPEVITQSGHGWQADIWSLGCTVMEMLTAMAPFQHVSRSQISVMQFIVDETLPITTPEGISEEARDLLMAMLQREPENRPMARTCMTHPFLEDVVEIVDQLERSDTNESMTQEQKKLLAQKEMQTAAALEKERLEEEQALVRRLQEEGPRVQREIEEIRQHLPHTGK